MEPPYCDTIDWAKWHVFLVDERVVPKTNVDSNYKLAYDGFISKVYIHTLCVKLETRDFKVTRVCEFQVVIIISL